MRLFRLTLLFLWMIMPATVSLAWGAAGQVVTFGADLNQEQKDAMLRVFGITANTAGAVTKVEVSNAEEKRYLKGLVPENVIGTRSISSAYVELLPAGRGVSAETYNITWVTGAMYSNALITAGVKDAKVIAAAPFPVSGTAALTGVFKAFETATGTKLSEERKQAAHEELVRTGELGQQIQDKDKATKLIVLVKEKVLQNKLTSPEEIKSVVINIAGQLNINLSADQIDRIVELMVRISKTPVSIEEFRGQLAGIQEKINLVLEKQEQAKGILDKLWTAILGFINQIMAIFKGGASAGK
ncbi:MAG: DUF1002 domain-containing protein [Clostridia bacterium]|nr:DUF1002 domain-containing protein [Clostridia bacterium]